MDIPTEKILLKGVIGEHDLVFQRKNSGLVYLFREIPVPDVLESKKYYRSKVLIEEGTKCIEREIDLRIEPERLSLIGRNPRRILLVFPWHSDLVDLKGYKIALSIDPVAKPHSLDFSEFERKLNESADELREKVRNLRGQT